jgi:hypothetical protein
MKGRVQRSAFICLEISSGGLGGEAPPTTEEEAKADDERMGMAKPPLPYSG